MDQAERLRQIVQQQSKPVSRIIPKRNIMHGLLRLQVAKVVLASRAVRLIWLFYLERWARE